MNNNSHSTLAATFTTNPQFEVETYMRFRLFLGHYQTASEREKGSKAEVRSGEEETARVTRGEETAKVRSGETAMVRRDETSRVGKG